MSLVISIDELKDIFDLTIKKLENDCVSAIELDEVLYWFINTNCWDVSFENPELLVGSIKDDLEGLRKCQKNGEIVSYIELDRLAFILRAISEKYAPIQ